MAKATLNKLNSVLEFITEYISIHNYPPTVREICVSANVSSSATAQYYLDKLEKLGKIRRSVAQNRSIELVDKEPLNKLAVNTIPLVGTVSCGTPIYATENIQDMLAFSKNILSGDADEMFALKVKGDSMKNIGILDGDTAIIKKQSVANNGDIVVALIEDSATIKRFFKESDHIRLQPENETFDPIILQNCEILGLVKGIFRAL